MLHAAKTGLRLGGALNPDGEETQRLFDAWETIAPHLGLGGPRCEVHAAVVNMRTLLRTLYRSLHHGRPAPDCAGVTRAFREHVAPRSGSHYLLFLEVDCAAVLEAVAADGFGMAMFSGDIVETLNRLLKRGFNDHSGRGGGQGGWKGAMKQCLEWLFLYFDGPLRKGSARNHCCVAQQVLEGSPVAPASSPTTTSSSFARTSPNDGPATRPAPALRDAPVAAAAAAAAAAADAAAAAADGGVPAGTPMLVDGGKASYCPQ